MKKVNTNDVKPLAWSSPLDAGDACIFKRIIRSEPLDYFDGEE